MRYPLPVAHTSRTGVCAGVCGCVCVCIVYRYRYFITVLAILCLCVYCGLVCAFKITNNLRSLRSSLIWYYYFGAPQMKRYYIIALCWKYIMAHHHHSSPICIVRVLLLPHSGVLPFGKSVLMLHCSHSTHSVRLVPYTKIYMRCRYTLMLKCDLYTRWSLGSV